MRRCTATLTGLFLLSAAAAGEAYRLRVTPAGNPQQVLADIPLPATGEWCLHWHHSVQGFLVRDCFAVDASGTLYLDHSHQPDFAAGLDHIPGRGRLESDRQGGYVIRDINEPVAGNSLRLRVGSRAVDHRIAAGDKSVSLSERAAHKPVEIQLQIDQ